MRILTIIIALYVSGCQTVDEYCRTDPYAKHKYADYGECYVEETERRNRQAAAMANISSQMSKDITRPYQQGGNSGTTHTVVKKCNSNYNCGYNEVCYKKQYSYEGICISK